MCPCHPDNGEFVYALLAAAAVLAGVGLMRKHWARMKPGARTGGILCLIALVGLLGYRHGGFCSKGNTLTKWQELGAEPALVGTTAPAIPTPTESRVSTDEGADGAVSASSESGFSDMTRVTSPVEPAPASEPGTTVIAYYFHRTMRCYSCQMIEDLSKEAVEQNFSGELAAGLLEFRAVNTDEPDNSHFEDDYQLSVQSLVLVRVENGRVAEWKNLEKVWDLFEDYGAFVTYVQEEVKGYLHR